MEKEDFIRIRIIIARHVDDMMEGVIIALTRQNTIDKAWMNCSEPLIIRKVRER